MLAVTVDHCDEDCQLGRRLRSLSIDKCRDVRRAQDQRYEYEAWVPDCDGLASPTFHATTRRHHDEVGW
ncbi:hypothetical protein D3C83_51330 [compost metagenome]